MLSCVRSDQKGALAIGMDQSGHLKGMDPIGFKESCGCGTLMHGIATVWGRGRLLNILGIEEYMSPWK